MTIIKEENKASTFYELNYGDVFYSEENQEYCIKIEESSDANAIDLSNGGWRTYDDTDKVYIGKSKLIVNF